jgi:hypothetical protein
MSTLQEVREAHQMWEWKFENAGRESIVLRDGKSKCLFRSLLSKNASKMTKNGFDVKLVVSKSRA